MSRERVGRLKKLVFTAFAALGLGLLYAFFVSVTGLGVPCLFRLATGLLCPGCGVSRMCMALLRLDFGAAFEANPAVFCLLPAGAAVAVKICINYVKTGSLDPGKFCNAVLTVMIVALIAFGIVRNLPI